MKRYTTEDQIIKDIDKCYSRAQVLSQQAEQLDAIADNLFKYPDAIEDAKEKRLLAAKTRQTANNLVNRKAKRLGEKLSEFRTTIMPFAAHDTSVSQRLSAQ